MKNSELTQIKNILKNELGMSLYKGALYRRRSDFVQFVHFQTDRHNKNLVTVNFSSVPLYIPYSENLKGLVILSPGGRISKFQYGHDKWWDIKQKSELDELEKLVFENMFDWLNLASTPLNLIEIELKSHFRTLSTDWRYFKVGLSYLKLRRYDDATKYLIECQSPALPFIKTSAGNFLSLIRENPDLAIDKLDSIYSENLKTWKLE